MYRIYSVLKPSRNYYIDYWKCIGQQFPSEKEQRARVLEVDKLKFYRRDSHGCL